MLRNLIYTGKIKYRGEIYEGEHEPIVSEEMFRLAQEKHKKAPQNLRKYKHFLFSGLIRCSECGSFMTPYYVSKKPKGVSKRYYYYRCTATFKRDWNVCGTRQINANNLEQYIFDNLKRISMDDVYIENLIFRHNHKNACPAVENNETRGHSGLVPGQDWGGINPDLFRQGLKSFLSAVDNAAPSMKVKIVCSNIKNILFSKYIIRIYLYHFSGHEAVQKEEIRSDKYVHNKMVDKELRISIADSILTTPERVPVLIEIPSCF